MQTRNRYWLVYDLKAYRNVAKLLGRLGIHFHYTGIGLLEAKNWAESKYHYVGSNNSPHGMVQQGNFIEQIKTVRRCMYMLDKLNIKHVDPSLKWGKQYADNRRKTAPTN